MPGIGLEGSVNLWERLDLRELLESVRSGVKKWQRGLRQIESQRLDQLASAQASCCRLIR